MNLKKVPKNSEITTKINNYFKLKLSFASSNLKIFILIYIYNFYNKN